MSQNRNEKDYPVAVVLGGTSPHIELIYQLQDRGYFVILADYLDNPPAKDVADLHVKISTLDEQAVLSVAKRHNAKLVISTCIDQANSVCCYVAEKLNLPRPYDYQTSLNVTDKGLMKKIMVSNGIPTSPYFVVESVDDICWEKIEFPVVVKPVDCNSSKGVHRADTREEVCKYVEEDLSYSRKGNAIIEGFNEGAEIQVDCFATDDYAEVLLTRQKRKIIGGNGIVLQSTGSIIPAILSEEEVQQVKDIAIKIAKGFGLKNTPFFYQAIVTEKGISVLEFAPRIGGGLSYYLLKEIAGVDSVEVAIDSFLGNHPNVKPHKVKKFYSTNLLYMNPGVFDHIEGMENLKDTGIIKDFFQMKKRGTRIDNDFRSGNRVGAFVIEAESRQVVKMLEEQAYKKIKIINENGDDALNRSIAPVE